MPGISLLVPGLQETTANDWGIDKPSQWANQYPGLWRFFHYALPRSNHLYTLDDKLQQAFNCATGLPFAASVTEASQTYTSLCYPVHLKTDPNSVLVFPVSFTSQEINHLINDLNDFFKPDCLFEINDDQYIVLHLTAIKPVPQVHYLSVIGKQLNLFDSLQSDVKDWQLLITELQMFLHQHPLNQHRLSIGQLPINSFWFFGYSESGDPSNRSLSVYSDDLLMRKLAGHLNHSPESFEALNFDVLDQDALIVDTRVLQSLKGLSDQHLPEILQQIDSTVLLPLSKKSLPQSVTLWTGGSQSWCYRPRHRFRFWRKRYFPESIFKDRLER